MAAGTRFLHWGQWSVAVWGTVAKRRVYVSSRGDRGSVSGADCYPMGILV